MSHPLLTPTRLRCDSLTDPLGHGTASPRLSWELTGTGRGLRQTAWQVRAAGHPALLADGSADLWDSGRVEGGRTWEVPYAGQPLGSRQRVWWQVRAWDGEGRPGPWSEPATFELGLLQPEDWRARWIGAAGAGGKWVTAPAPFFRREFHLAAAPRRARLYGTALGLVHFHCNGRRVGDEEFVPGWTNYHRRVQYRVWDLTPLLQAGDNVLGAVLGDGWYCGHLANVGRQVYGERPLLLAQLEVELADGTSVTLGTDGTWTTATGPILESDIYMGEIHDARRELTGWDRPGRPTGEWRAATVEDPTPAPAVVAMMSPPVRVTRELRPVAEPVRQTGWNSQGWVFDLGQNLTGRVRLRLRYRRGATVLLRFAEILDKDGRLYTENLRSARCTDSYTFAGDGEEVFEPRFTFHGFRYVAVGGDGDLPALTAENLTALVLHSDLPAAGEFSCSHPLLNRLQQNIDWGLRGNFLDIPTDCPQRDERLGWTGDAQIFVRTACFNRDVETFFARWQQDLEDAQNPAGGIPAIIPDTNPTAAGEGDAGPAWSDAVIICPWTIHLCFGHTRALERHYPSMVRYLEFLVSKSVGLVRGHPDGGYWGGFGDWLALDHGGQNPGRTRRDLIGTAYLAYDAGLLARIARALSKTGDAARWADLQARTAEAFRRRFVTPEGLVLGETQTGYALALAFDLLLPTQRPVAARALARLVEEAGRQLNTGFVGTSYLCRALSENGHLDLAYALLERQEYPSWLFPVTQGATTIWERWDGWTRDKGFQDKGMNSFNHYAYGAIGQWMYATVAGLDLDPDEPGGRHLLFQPHPGGSLTHASARWHGPCGPTAIAWRKEGADLALELVVPPNARATLRLPPAYTGGLSEIPADGAAPAVLPPAPDGSHALGSGLYRLLARAGGDARSRS